MDSVCYNCYVDWTLHCSSNRNIIFRFCYCCTLLPSYSGSLRLSDGKNISMLPWYVLVMLHWSLFITNLSIHANDSQLALSPYIYAVGAAFFLYTMIVVFIPYIQSRTRIQYSTIELIHSFLMFALCAMMLGLLGWAIIESP